MNVLLIGSGGREHAIAHSLVASPLLTKLFVAPGNGGTAGMAKTENVAIPLGNIDAQVAFAQEHNASLTVVGPEAPLVAGIVDRFQAAGLPVFGPTQAAAQIEGSKAFAKEFMVRNGIPTGDARAFTDFDEAMRYLRALDATPVIKASGLAAGKGVIIPETLEDAAAVVRSMLIDGRFGAASSTVLIEERLSGPEVSVLAFCDGTSFRVMPAAQDHKRLLDGDQGPNTGGMGAFAPSPLMTRALQDEIERTILAPALTGLAAEGMPYTGVLYAGLMLTPGGPKVLEFNCRFGDPEAQVLIPLLESDLFEVFQACVAGTLSDMRLRWRTDSATTVVMASHGYPGDHTVGVEITGIAEAEAIGCLVFHAGTKYKDHRLVTAGGRVLAVTALGRSIAQAAHRAYDGIECVQFNNPVFRRDIGLSKPRRMPRRRR